MIRFDTLGARQLSADLPRLGFMGARSVIDAMGESAGDLTRTWARNARETAGTHGRLYPQSIDFNMKVSTDIVFEVGPNPNKPQGGMSFEFGSSKQPPHLDGQRAMDEVQPRLEKRVSDAVMGVFEKAASGGKAPLQEYTTKAGVTRLATPAQIANWTRARQ